MSALYGYEFEGNKFQEKIIVILLDMMNRGRPWTCIGDVSRPNMHFECVMAKAFPDCTFTSSLDGMFGSGTMFTECKSEYKDGHYHCEQNLLGIYLKPEYDNDEYDDESELDFADGMELDYDHLLICQKAEEYEMEMRFFDVNKMKIKAAQFETESMMVLGVAYYCGLYGVEERSLKKAWHYFLEAAKCGNEDATQLIQSVFLDECKETLHNALRANAIAPEHFAFFFDIALKQGRTELTAELLEYKNRILSMNAKDDHSVDPLRCDSFTFVVGVKPIHFKDHNTIVSFIESRGGRVTKNVSSKTTFLIADQDDDSAKVRKAKEIGTAIISEEQFVQLFGKEGL